MRFPAQRCGIGAAALLCVAMALSGCRRETHQDPPEVTQGVGSNTENSAEETEQSSSVAQVVQAVNSATGWDLPDLKPIARGPFPDGATEEQVCEAISDTKEEDLWVRFGHLVPLYERGSILILDVGPQRARRVHDYVMSEYLGGGRWGPQIKGCGRLNKSLLYIRTMGPDAVMHGTDIFTGPKHLSESLQKDMGIGTEAHFTFEHRSLTKEDRLARYCRKDAELCERLVMLLSGPEVQGLCPFALTEIGVGPFEDRAQLLQVCRESKPTPFACTFWASSDAEHASCRKKIRAELHLDN